MSKIRRILFILGFVAAVSSAFAGYLRTHEILLACTVLLFIATLFIVLKVKFPSLKWFAVISVCAAIFLILGFHIKVYKIKPVAGLAGNSAIVYGYLYDDPVMNGSYQTLNIRTESIALEGAPQNIKLGISTPVSDSYKAGDRIKADVKFSSLNSAYKNSYYADGIYINATSYNVSAAGGEPKLTLRIAGVKLARAIKNKIALLFPADYLGVLNGLCLGDTELMPDETYNNFVGSGIIHLVNVSGLHLSIIAGSLYSLLKGISKKIAVPVTAVVLLVFLSVTGFSESAIRAGIIYFIMLSGEVFSRKSDTLNSLGLAALIMIAANPMVWASISFLLTCISTAGIVLLHGPVSAYVASVFRGLCTHAANVITGSRLEAPARALVKFIGKAWDAAAISISANIAVTPVLLIIYGRLSLLSVFANLMTVTLVMYTLVALIITIIFSFVPFASVLTKPLVIAISAVCRYTEWVAKIFGSTEVSSLSFNSETSWLIVIFLLITVGSVLLATPVRRLNIYTVIILCITAPLAGVLAANLGPDYNCKIIIPDVGQGYCAIAVSGSEAVIIGAGDDYSDAYIIDDELKRASVDTVRAVILPGGENASGGALRLQSTYACDIYTQNTDEYAPSVGIKEIDTLNIKLGEINITPLSASEGYAVNANVYGKDIIFQSKNIGDIDGCTRSDCLIMSPGAANSQIGISAETLLITGGGEAILPLNVKTQVTLGSVYILGGKHLVNLPKGGKIEILSSRSVSFAY